jgi:hypothetical protein
VFQAHGHGFVPEITIGCRGADNFGPGMPAQQCHNCFLQILLWMRAFHE